MTPFVHKRVVRTVSSSVAFVDSCCRDGKATLARCCLYCYEASFWFLGSTWHIPSFNLQCKLNEGSLPFCYLSVSGTFWFHLLFPLFCSVLLFTSLFFFFLRCVCSGSYRNQATPGVSFLRGLADRFKITVLSSEAYVQQYPSEVPCVPQVVTSSRSVSVKEIVFPLIIFTKLFIYSILWSSSSLIARLTSPLTASNGTMLWLMSYFRLTTLKSTLSGEKILCTATVNHKEHISSDLIRRIFSHSY